MESVNTGARRYESTLPFKVSAEANLADDLIYGADKIAEFLFGHVRFRRRVYYLVETGRLPVLRLPGICARKSTLTNWFAEQEKAAQIHSRGSRAPPA